MTFIKQCFFIDDDSDDRELFCETVQNISTEIDCRTASTGIEALGYLSDHPEFTPECIFIDMNMPLLNGVESLNEIRKIGALAHAQIYLFSTVSTPKLRDDALALGAVGFLEKPTSMQQMHEMLLSILKKQ